MNSEWTVWLLVLGLSVVGAILWFLYGHLPRSEEDVDATERAVEAEWISSTLAARDVDVPPEHVQRVLLMHRHYLAGPALDVEPPPAEPEPRQAVQPAPRAAPPRPASRPAPHTASRSAGDAAHVKRHDPRRESPEADVRQPG